MISSMKITETIGKIAEYKELQAVASRTVNDDGEVKIISLLSIMGFTMSLPEALLFLAALPKAIERASGLAARLEVSESYESPKVTPIGNMNDLLSQVCASDHDEENRLEKKSLPLVPRNCAACKFSGIEPQDMDLTCGHPDAGPFGVHVLRQPADHCPGWKKFEQHPGRNPDGSLVPWKPKD